LTLVNVRSPIGPKLARMHSTRGTILVNRAPVLTLWAAVVAHCLGFDWNEALTRGRAVAGLNAYAKGKALDVFAPAPKEVREQRHKTEVGESLTVDLLHRAIPVVCTPDGLRAVSKGRPVSPESVQRYLEGKFGDVLEIVHAAMACLARSLPPQELAERAYDLYEDFRPEIPPGKNGWGAPGTLDVGLIESLALKA
jgi:hypothetical protein